ncbi:SpoIIE family protein phosphatase [Salinibacterium sp. G-O1]|uniref:PP2C family protein-serine/threonine phosphatase n=1 Tax=Salinibacterium sp. G-O1 TaxID=3046208 RepID=UPI0024B8C8B6|nr:SpoIIE family protein phosphatase [Salinibacterium sp. G-O1]MDJ0335568.1 SpoIIE family protein phosphatase [Salinibacterium sp. G-O1]
MDTVVVVDDDPLTSRLDIVSRLMQQFFGVRSAAISILEGEREWVKASSGVVRTEVARKDSFMEIIDASGAGTVTVRDTQADPRFDGHPYVWGEPHLRFWAGHALMGPGGERVGAVGLFDTRPRVFLETEKSLLADVARWIQGELNASRELDRAAQVQRGLLPKRLLSLPGFDVAGDCRPAQAVGGDFFDWYPVGEGAVFTLGDVMGKGIGAAIIAATVRAVLRAGSRHEGLATSVESAAVILDSDLDESGVFVTLFHSRLDMDTGVVTYVDAGHGLSVIVRRDGTAERLSTNDFPLGVDSEAQWSEHSVKLNVGDTLILLSDGVLDLFDGSLDALTEVEGIVRRSRTSQEVVDNLVALTGGSQPDDVTVVVVRSVAY